MTPEGELQRAVRLRAKNLLREADVAVTKMAALTKQPSRASVNHRLSLAIQALFQELGETQQANNLQIIDGLTGSTAWLLLTAVPPTHRAEVLRQMVEGIRDVLEIPKEDVWPKS